MMDYKEMKATLEKMSDESYENFAKAIISFEKGIDDEKALDELYIKYMNNDSMGLLSDEFDYMIDEMKENGLIKESDKVEKENDNLINIIGNVAGDISIIDRKNIQGEVFKVVNFTVVFNDKEGGKVYTDCSAYGDKADIPKNFKKGDFVKLFGQLRTSTDDNGKSYSNVKVLSSKLLKAREQENKESKSSILGAINKFKQEEKSVNKVTKESVKENER